MIKLNKVWLITGTSRGMGKAIAETALKNGDCVVATTRKENGLDLSEEYENKFLNLQLDVDNFTQEQINSVVKKAIKKFGKIDVLVNNAGHGRITNFEETSEEKIREIFELNVFGLMRVTRAVLPMMRKQKSGHLFNIASAAGYCAGPGIYHTSKFAVAGFSTTLAFEVAPFGIKVTNVALGLFRTNFYDKGAMGIDADIHIEDYDSNRWQDDFVKSNSHNEHPGDPVKLNELIYEVSNVEKPPLHLPVGIDAVNSVEGYANQILNHVKTWKEKSTNTNFMN